MISRGRQLGLVGFALFALSLAFLERGAIRDALGELSKPSVPPPVAYPSSTSTPTISPTIAQTPTPKPAVSVNLDIPFVSQAPYKIWDADHEEFCEEAASLMVASYIKGDHSVTDPNVAEAALQRIKTWEMDTFGYFKDTTAAETARIIHEYFGVAKVQVVANPTQTQIREWVAAGRAIIVPSAGRLLHNPNFTGAGPLYHMIVIKGYTASGLFITNDAGTRKGANYIYEPSVIMNAMHDWNGGDVDHGAKVAIVVG